MTLPRGPMTNDQKVTFVRLAIALLGLGQALITLVIVIRGG